MTVSLKQGGDWSSPWLRAVAEMSASPFGLQHLQNVVDVSPVRELTLLRKRQLLDEVEPIVIPAPPPPPSAESCIALLVGLSDE